MISQSVRLIKDTSNDKCYQIGKNNNNNNFFEPRKYILGMLWANRHSHILQEQCSPYGGRFGNI